MSKSDSTFMEPVIRQQGWTDETVLDLAMGFINLKQLADEFVEYLKQLAAEENEAAAEDALDDEENCDG